MLHDRLPARPGGIPEPVRRVAVHAGSDPEHACGVRELASWQGEEKAITEPVRGGKEHRPRNRLGLRYRHPGPATPAASPADQRGSAREGCLVGASAGPAAAGHVQTRDRLLAGNAACSRRPRRTRGSCARCRWGGGRVHVGQRGRGRRGRGRGRVGARWVGCRGSRRAGGRPRREGGRGWGRRVRACGRRSAFPAPCGRRPAARPRVRGPHPAG